MQIDIKLHKNDLPDELKLDDKKSLAIDSEFSGLNVNRDKLYLVQISTGNNDCHIIQLNRKNYNAKNLVKILEDEKIKNCPFNSNWLIKTHGKEVFDQIKNKTKKKLDIESKILNDNPLNNS